eukprot:762862-Hanusia_phi.AAC.1
MSPFFIRSLSLPAGSKLVKLFSSSGRRVRSLSSMSSSRSQVEHGSLPDRRLCVAPMMDWTDRYDRFFLRLMSKNTWMYSEMVTTSAILNGNQDRLLSFFPQEHPIALQLGGSEPKDLAESARVGESYGYDEINLNVGCPSERVSSGAFGACLMAEPELVRDCVAAMRERVKVPVTVKHRIGIDNLDSYELLCRFVSTVEEGGCRTFIVHARKAILKGLSPKENREIPPLRYDVVHQLKKDFPHLEIIINGGITDLAQARAQLEQASAAGVEVERNLQRCEWISQVKATGSIRGAGAGAVTLEQIIEEMVPFIDEQLSAGVSLNSITRHM